MIFTIQEDNMGLWHVFSNGLGLGLTFRSADEARKLVGAIIDHAVLPPHWQIEFRTYDKSPSELWGFKDVTFYYTKELSDELQN